MTTSPRLLFVESDSFFAGFAARHFRRVGFDVVHANHGQEALTLLAEQSFDAILTELVLPVVDGYQFLDALRAHKSYAKLPVSILTRMSTREDVERCAEQGVQDYFIKPHHRIDAVAERLIQPWRVESL